MTRLSDALDACLRLMDRAAPHPDDAALWHDTRREASKALALHRARVEDNRSWWRGAWAWAAAALFLFAIFGM